MNYTWCVAEWSQRWMLVSKVDLPPHAFCAASLWSLKGWHRWCQLNTGNLQCASGRFSQVEIQTNRRHIFRAVTSEPSKNWITVKAVEVVEWECVESWEGWSSPGNKLFCASSWEEWLEWREERTERGGGGVSRAVCKGWLSVKLDIVNFCCEWDTFFPVFPFRSFE